MSKSNKIVCLQVPPGYQEGDYVGKLFRGLSRNTSVPFEFECVTASKYPGWWGKLEVFDPPERVIFLDLDTVITGNVDFLFEYNGPFAILRDFGTPRGDNYGSAVMSISAGYGKQVIEGFKTDADSIMKRLYGDGNWIRESAPGADFWQDIYPGKIKSFKVDDLENGPKGASIVCYHGSPRPHEMTHLGWMREFWK